MNSLAAGMTTRSGFACVWEGKIIPRRGFTVCGVLMEGYIKRGGEKENQGTYAPMIKPQIYMCVYLPSALQYYRLKLVDKKPASYRDHGQYIYG